MPPQIRWTTPSPEGRGRRSRPRSVPDRQETHMPQAGATPEFWNLTGGPKLGLDIRNANQEEIDEILDGVPDDEAVRMVGYHRGLMVDGDEIHPSPPDVLLDPV